MASKVKLILILCLAFMTGCQSDVDTYTQDGRLIVRFWHGMGGELGLALNELVNTYNKSQDKTHVHLEFMGRYEILEQKIIAAVMAGKTPDLAQMYEGPTVFLTRDKGEESLIDLKPKVDQWPGFQDFFEAFQRNSIYEDGKIYSIPFNKSFPVLFYNNEILKLLGISSAPSNWEELASYAKDCHAKVVLDRSSRELRLRTLSDTDQTAEAVMGFAFPIDPWIYETLLLQNGGKMTDEAETKVFFDSEMAAQAMDFWIRSVAEGYGYKAEGFNHQNDFGARKVAFIITSVVSHKYMEKKLNFDFSMAPIPFATGPGTKKVSVMSGTNVCVFKTSSVKRQDAAWEFIKWFSEPAQSARWATKTFYVPVRKQSLKEPEFVAWMQKTKGSNAAIDQLPYGDSEPRTSAWYRCRMILREHMESIISQAMKEKNLEKARLITRQELKKANERMNTELAKYNFK